jgi:DNA-binding transcriptional ArsR family regulator
MDADEPTTIDLDSRAITVLAHPLRSRILGKLRLNGGGTATSIARLLDTNTGATSYHLRKLAEVGLVEETTDGQGKERWWKPTSDRHRFTASALAGDPDAEAAHDWLQRHYFGILAEQYNHWLDTATEWSIDWQDAAGASDFLVELSPAKAAELTSELAAVIERYRAMPADDDSELTRIHVVGYPAK